MITFGMHDNFKLIFNHSPWFSWFNEPVFKKIERELMILLSFKHRSAQRLVNSARQTSNFASSFLHWSPCDRGPYLSIISLTEIAISNRNAEKKAQNEQNSSAKENSNDVKRQHFDVFMSSLSFDVSKSDDQKNLDFSVDFFTLFIEQRTTTLIRVWCKFCTRCVKSTALCVRVVSSINC